MDYNQKGSKKEPCYFRHLQQMRTTIMIMMMTAMRLMMRRYPSLGNFIHPLKPSMTFHMLHNKIFFFYIKICERPDVRPAEVQCVGDDVV
jgi:hypothetical protein